jgi:uncharacterized protein
LKTSLSHLPEHKQKELKELIAMIVELMVPDFVILFGSYARGNWVEDRYVEEGITYEYKSDYDILVVTETKYKDGLEDKWRATEKKAAAMPTTVPVNLIHHSYGYLKSELAHGSYFFTDILKDGIMLYDNGRNAKFPLVIPDTIDPEKVKARAKEEYELWFTSANNFFSSFRHSYNDGHLKEAAFHLHQTTERLYTALLLVFTGYKAKIHDIEELGSQAEAISEEFKKIFPRDTPENTERFKLLKKAYIDARYKKNYTITKEDLEYLSVRVEMLKETVEMVCGKRVQ